MAAIHAAQGPHPVLLFESTADGGRKILISGGGRCNVLPSVARPEVFCTESSPNSLRKILTSWPVSEQRAFFETTLAIPLQIESETGKVFPTSNRARDVRDALHSEAEARGVDLRFETRVKELVSADDEGLWSVRTTRGHSFRARSVIVATGGLSVPKTGSDGWGLGMARRLGHAVVQPYPALTPLTVDPNPFAGLAGVSCKVTITIPPPAKPHSTSGGFLFTHRGYSGPAVLNASHFAVQAEARGDRQPLHVAWGAIGEDEWDRTLQGSSGTVGALMRRHLPKRLADALVDIAELPGDTRTSQLTRSDRIRCATALGRFNLPWSGSEGYKKAEVTGGGVALGEVSPRTLESRRSPGLFLCGEILDAFGPIGGYNFAWAWATGRLAGRGAAGAA